MAFIVLLDLSPLHLLEVSFVSNHEYNLKLPSMVVIQHVPQPWAFFFGTFIFVLLYLFEKRLTNIANHPGPYAKPSYLPTKSLASDLMVTILTSQRHCHWFILFSCQVPSLPSPLVHPCYAVQDWLWPPQHINTVLCRQMRTT